MASKAAQKRLTKEYVAMQRSPPPFVWAAPDEKNILNWNFIIRGPPDSPYHGGEYHGLIMFPPDYPFKPPGIKMLTPSGRFQTDKKICFSMSDYHPGTWNPAWSVATICTGILSFMLSDEMTTGSMTSTDRDKRLYAQRSHEWNRQQRKFIEAFPDYCGETMKDLPNMGEQDRGSPSQPVTPSPPTLAPVAPPEPAPALGTNPTVPAEATRAPAAVPAKPEAPPLGWAASWKLALYEKWRWAALIAFAVVLSRLSN